MTLETFLAIIGGFAICLGLTLAGVHAIERWRGK